MRPRAAARRARAAAADRRPLFLRGRAHDPVVAGRADLRRRARLELVGHDAVAYLGDRRPHALELLLRVLDRDLLAVEHVVVALRRGLELPRLARAHLVDRELDVLAQILRRLRAAGLVIDQLVRAIGMAVDAVDPAPQKVTTQLERERALDPLGARVGRAVVLPVPP